MSTEYEVESQILAAAFSDDRAASILFTSPMESSDFEDSRIAKTFDACKAAFDHDLFDINLLHDGTLDSAVSTTIKDQAFSQMYGVTTIERAIQIQFQKSADKKERIALSNFQHDPSDDHRVKLLYALSRQKKTLAPAFEWLEDIQTEYPNLRPEVIKGLLRKGELINIISSPKIGKSYLVIDLAIAMILGGGWLGFECTKGRVLLIDNELHKETIAHRNGEVFAARAYANGMAPEGGSIPIKKAIAYRSLRGDLKTVPQLQSILGSFPKDFFKLIILDAFYKFIPEDVDENSNSEMAQIYGMLEKYANDTGACFAIVHHSTKGDQYGKNVTDVGSGAGTMSRATDTHLVLRTLPDDDKTVIVDFVARTFPKINPKKIAFQYPIWNVIGEIDMNGPRPQAQAKKPDPPKPKGMMLSEFINKFIEERPKLLAEIEVEIEEKQEDVTVSRMKQLIEQGLATGRIHEWTFGKLKGKKYALIEQPKQGSVIPGEPEEDE